MDAHTAMELYLAAKRAENLRPNSLVSYRRELTRFFSTLPAGGATHIDELTPCDIRKVIAVLFDQGLAAGSVQLCRVVTLAWLGWLARAGYIDRRDWGEQIPKVRRDYKLGRSLNLSDVACLVKAAGECGRNGPYLHSRNRAMISLMLDSGLRAGEIARLRVDDLDLAACLVRVSEECKGRVERIVPFGTETQRHLRYYLRERAGVDSNRVWLSVHGKPLATKDIWQLIRRIGEAAGLKCHPHLLRHTAATLLGRNGMPLLHIQRLLGHKHVETTMRYLHLCDEDVREQYPRACPMDNLPIVAVAV